MIIIGLTGSIGMGKSTVAAMFNRAGAAIWNADDAVHRLYAKGGEGVPLIAASFPSAVVDDEVDRGKLAELVLGVPENLQRLESIIHPLVGEDRGRFIEAALNAKAPMIVLDIPLLFESGAEAAFHTVIVVSASKETQKSRVLARPGMSEEKFEAILKSQLPDEEKRARADFVINTDQLIEETRKEVNDVVRQLREKFPKTPLN